MQKDVGLKVYARELDNMKKLASDVALLPVFVPMKMMLMNCSEINQVHFFNISSLQYLENHLFLLFIKNCLPQHFHAGHQGLKIK